MTDAAVIAVCAATLATVQGISTAWLTHTVNRNACGAGRCLATLAREKLEGEYERTNLTKHDLTKST